MNLENFKNRNWIKHWAGHWQLLNNSLLGYQYTKLLKDEIGRGLEVDVIISHQDRSVAYLDADDYKKFATYLAEKVVYNEESLQHWTDLLHKKADGILNFIESTKKQKAFAKEGAQNFINIFYSYSVPHRVVKVVVDGLSPDKLEKFLPKLEEARVYAEPVYAETEKFIEFLADKIAKETCYNVQQLPHLTKEEFLEYWDSGKLPSREEMEKRYYATAILYKEGEFTLLTGEEVGEVEMIVTNQSAVGEETWTKNWSGNWCLLLGSSYGDIYTKGLKELVGRGFKKFFVTFESGTSANYLNQAELAEHCHYLVSLIEKDNTLPERWVEQVMINSDKIFALFKEIANKKIYTRRDYEDLQEYRYRITMANFSIKKVIDFLPDDLREKYLPLFTKARLHSEPVYNEADEYLRIVVGYLLQNRLSVQALAVLTKEDLTEFFASGNLPSEEILLERYGGCALEYNQTGEVKIYQGEEYKKLMSGIAKQSTGQEIKGQIAYRGKVTGRVRVVSDPKNCLDFREGDILVTGMTRPEYLSLMKKSGAFVTDAGGLLSHAAIVARELKKPCIIGTEVATKFLKDGDMVEVDAEKGIVKKLNY